MQLNEASVNTFWVKIFIAGPIEVAKQLLREECMREGLCVTIEPTTYMYTGGEETGYVVGFINYPRFPVSPEQLLARAKQVMITLLENTYQRSATLMSPLGTTWYSIGDTT